MFDGDNPNGGNERCELAKNDWRRLATPDNQSGTFYAYHQGMRRATYLSILLPQNFPLSTNNWQNVVQIKQAGPANGSGGTPILSIKAFQGDWQLFHTQQDSECCDVPIWETPAQKGIWTRIAIDAYYSQNSSDGWVKLYVDRFGDGDFSDSGEQSPLFPLNTLKRETAGSSGDGLSQDDSIPSHLRAGIYHDPAINCASSDCSVYVDNVQVVAP